MFQFGYTQSQSLRWDNGGVFFCILGGGVTRLEVILLILRSNDNTMKNIQLAVEPGVASYFRKLTSFHPIINLPGFYLILMSMYEFIVRANIWKAMTGISGY